jgi:hypothetical protein
MRQRRSNVEDVPTFRVFVKYARPLATEQEETELRGLFEGCGKVTRFTTRLGQWCNSFVTFSSTDGAKKAREKLRGTSFQGQALDVQFAAPARRVVVRGFPRQVSFARVAEVFRLHRNVQIERDDIWQGNEDVAILFARVNDAKEFVIDVVARAITFEGHTLSFDFAKEHRRNQRGRHDGHEFGSLSIDRTRPLQNGLNYSGKANNLSPYDQRLGNTTSNNNGSHKKRSLPKDYRGRSVSRSRSRSRSNSPSTTKRNRSSGQMDSASSFIGVDSERVCNSDRERVQKRHNSNNNDNWSFSGSEDKDEVAGGFLGYFGSPKALLDHLANSPVVASVAMEKNITIGDEGSGARNVAADAKVQYAVNIHPIIAEGTHATNDIQQRDEMEGGNRGKEGPTPVVVDDGADGEQHVHHEQQEDANQPCVECIQLLGGLRSHISEHHSSGPNEVQKAVIKTWFECHYVRKGNANDSDGAAGEIPVAVSRTTLLGEINTFLRSMGWPTWKTQSALYKDWFLREIMSLSDNDVRKGRNWSLFYKDGFAPGGDGDGARNRRQRMDEMIAKLRTYMHE